MTHPYFRRSRHPRVLAHRGLLTAAGEDSGVWENSLGAFAAAQAAGVDYIETDCRVTADGDVVLFHDETLVRFTGDTRPVDQVRTAELAEIFSTHGGLLTVADALAAFPTTRFNIDVKTEAAVEPLGPIIAAHTHRVLLTGFSDARRRRAVSAVLRAGAAQRPATSGGQGTIVKLRLCAALRLPVGRVLRDIDAVQIPERFGPIRVLSPTLLRAAQRHDVEVHVWTINDPDDMQRLIAAGADGVVTDRADVAMKVLAPE